MRVFHYNDEEKELHQYLARRGHENVILPAEADPFQAVGRERFDAAFVGLHPHGLKLLEALKRRNPECFVTIITADREARRAVEAMKSGAFDYLLSPLDFAEVERTYIMMDRDAQMLVERRQLQTQLAEAKSTPRLLGESKVMVNLRRLVAKAAVSQASVLITGETGTGKELIAGLLHELSPRHKGPRLSINCNAIPTTLLESELFGYRRGAFSGADRDRQGLLSQADGGTFLLDEIHDLEPTLQGKLLRVLQEGEILPLGARAAQKVNVRFVATTNQNLEQLVQRGLFRADLFFRLNVVPISVPSLRDRPEDIAMLTRHFVEQYCTRAGRPPLHIAPAVWRFLSNHHWPGNVRELENLCHRAVVLSETGEFDTDILSLTTPAQTIDAATPAPFPGAEGELSGYRLARARIERTLLDRTLSENNWNISKSARALGISRTTFYAAARRCNVSLLRERVKAIPSDA